MGATVVLNLCFCIFWSLLWFPGWQFSLRNIINQFKESAIFCLLSTVSIQQTNSIKKKFFINYFTAKLHSCSGCFNAFKVNKHVIKITCSFGLLSAFLLFVLFQVKCLVTTLHADPSATTTSSRLLDSGCTDSCLLHTWACFTHERRQLELSGILRQQAQLFSVIVVDLWCCCNIPKPAARSDLVSSYSFYPAMWDTGQAGCLKENQWEAW